LEVALAAADLHVEAGDAAAAQTIMQTVHANLNQVLRTCKRPSLRCMHLSRKSLSQHKMTLKARVY
jgi:hypothetical protein